MVRDVRRLALPVLLVAITVPLLTGGCGGAEPASDAAAGELIAFSSFRNGARGIFVVAVDGGGVRRLASNTAGDPAWSPDGRQIAYFSEAGADPDCPECVDLYVMEADGSNQRRVTRSSGGFGGPAWAPDGKLIAFDGCQGGVDADEDSCAVYVIAPDGEGLRRVTPHGLDGQPVWSPDGKRIAFDGLVGDHEGIHVIGTDGSGLRRLTSSADSDPTWSPDGREIAFVRMTRLPGRDARLDIYVVGVAGGSARLADAGLKKAMDPAWSPDGELIAFAGWRELPGLCPDGAAIYVMAPDGSNGRRLNEGRPGYGKPTWSSDGREIAFESLSHARCMSEDVDEWPIHVMAADGSGERPLGPHAHTELGLAWQPVPNGGR